MELYNFYNISPQRGFLPNQNPRTQLPSTYLAWDELGRALPDLLLAGLVRAEVNKLPQLNITKLRNEADHERAMLILSFVAHAYLRQQQEIDRLPKQLAVPWEQIASKLGRLPVLAHASAVLNNWRLIDPDKPIGLSNLALIQPFDGGKDEAWFFLVTVAIEFHGAQLINGIVDIIGHSSAPEVALGKILDSLHRMTETLKRMPEHCDPYIFYHRLRPYLASITQVVYEGVDEAPLSFAGGSAAQSSLVQALDAAMDIGHHEPSSSKFLLEMRRYMPAKHRAFVEMLEKTKPLATLGFKYVTILEDIRSALHTFRMEHLKMYHLYVAAQQKKTALGDTGTGGTDAATFLRQMRNDTKGGDQN